MQRFRDHGLESQFTESGALIVGVQEGRAKEEQLRAGVYNQMEVAAASENGGHGVQAWFHQSLGPEFLAVKCGQSSFDDCCCETEQVVCLRDIDRRSRTHISL